MGTEEHVLRLAEKFKIATYHDTYEPDARSSPGLTALVDRATKGGNHVFFGEPHFDGMIQKQYQLMAHNPEMFQKASANGVKHLALEFPNVFQSAADDFMAGKTSRAAFSKALDNFQTNWVAGAAEGTFKDDFIRTLENAKAAGMKVHFADLTSAEDVRTLYPPSIIAVEKKFSAQYDTVKPKMSREEYIFQQTAALPEDVLVQLRRDRDEHTQQWRINRFDDTSQYLYLRERIPPHEGIMGVVGMDHLNNGMDRAAGHKIMGIDDHLESEGRKVTTIEVHTDKTKNFTRELAAVTERLPQDQPDYVVNLDKRTIESTQDGSVARMDGPPEIRVAERNLLKSGYVAFSY